MLLLIVQRAKLSYNCDRYRTSGNAALYGDAVICDCVLLCQSFQYLVSSMSGKKANAGPWIEIMTSRDSDHLNDGEAVQILFLFLCVFESHHFVEAEYVQLN